jgi:TonB-dependent starch-binding outer membrane protein SusC
MQQHLRSCTPPQRWLVVAQRCTLVLSLALVPVAQIFAQSTTISGKVSSSDDGAPLPGVTVLLKGSSTGTTTDAEGVFSLNVADPNGTLVFSFIGFTTQEVAINSRTSIDVTLNADVSELSEVVVIGYGEVKKSNVTGSIVSVKPEDLTRVPAGNVIESLQGNVPGMDVTRTSGAAGGNVSIRVRGQRSLTASNEPLIIVDGIQYNSIQDINPNDIERMEVLKDAASTAIYGSRGANGVILVTTKKGAAGKTRLSFNSYAGVSSINGYPDVQNGAEYAALRREANRAAGLWSSPADDANIFSTAELANIQNNKDTDWNDLMLRHGTQQEYQVGLSSATEKTSFYISLDYFNEKGLFRKDEVKRYSFRTNIDHNLSPKFKIGSQNQFSYYITDRRRDPLNTANKLSPLEDAYDSLGNVIPWLNNNKTVNPLMDEEGDNFTNNSVTTRLFTSFYVEYKPVKDLSFKSIIGVINANTRDGIYASALTVARNGLKPITFFTNTTSLGINVENILTYGKKFNDHAFTITGIQSLLRNKTEVHSSSGVNQLIPAQGYYGLANASEQIATGAPYVESGLLSYTGRIQYDYKEKYLLTLVGRSDGASQLSPGQKWEFFPSVSAAWRIAEESFMTDVQSVSDLKLRVSYGKAGNYSVKEYATQSNLARVPFAFDERLAVGYIFDTKLGNDNLSWEISSTINTGIDFGFLANRITGSIDIFKTKTDNLLLDRFLPSSSGATKIVQNVGKTETRGVEIALSAIPVQKDKFTWKVSASWFNTREKIVELASGANDVVNRWFIGEPTQAFYDYEKIGIWQSDETDLATVYNQAPGQIRVKDQNGDNKIDSNNDKVIIGTDRPNWIGSFTSDFKIGNFDLSFQVFARWGQTIQYDFANIYDPQANENSIKHDFWTPENPTHEFPRPNVNVSRSAMPYLSTLLYRDGSFVKLRGVTFGYNVPQSVLSKTPFTRIRVYVNGKNLLTRSKIDNYDPEGGGVETNPLSKLIVGGINLEF